MLRKIVFDPQELNNYQRGRISGIIWVLSGMPDEGFCWGMNDDGTELTHIVRCDDDQFLAILDAIHAQYPKSFIRTEES